MQTPTGDHFVPHSRQGSTSEPNLVASCQVCNSLKSDLVFESLEAARRYLLVERMRKGISTLFLPDVAMTEDASGWVKAYTAFYGA